MSAMQHVVGRKTGKQRPVLTCLIIAIPFAFVQSWLPVFLPGLGGCLTSWLARGNVVRAVYHCPPDSRTGKAIIRLSGESDDAGYNSLFRTAAEEFAEQCVTLSQGFPEYVTGDFIIPSIGQFEMGDRKFRGFLDCFGKLHRFKVDGNKVCASYRMMASGFYNESREKGTIGPGLLFFETDRPRETPWYLGPISNMPPFAPNDNTYVNTIRVGENLLSLTDSYTMLKIDQDSLKVAGAMDFKDDLEGLVCYTGSAHPVRNPNTGDWIDFVGNADLFSEKTMIRLFTLGENEPSIRKSIADVVMESAPYMHSFGVTSNYVVLPRMPVKFNVQDVAMKPMAAAFRGIDLQEESAENAFHIIPLDGSQGFVRTLPWHDPLWYVHTVNAFENASGIIIDLTTTPQNPFASDLTLDAARNKVLRDRGAANGKNLVKRFLLPPDVEEPVTTEILSDPGSSTDFPCINPKFASKPYCFYWAVEWFADSDSYASMAIVKHDICSSNKKLVWKRKDWYPSEAQFVPSSKDDANEDDGMLLFVALDGTSEQSFLMGVDAKTMETVVEAGPFPRIPFTTHGAFYPMHS